MNYDPLAKSGRKPAPLPRVELTRSRKGVGRRVQQTDNPKRPRPDLPPRLQRKPRPTGRICAFTGCREAPQTANDPVDEKAHDYEYCAAHAVLIGSVARLRTKGMTYGEIAKHLGIFLGQANEAGRQAGFHGHLKDQDADFVSAVAELMSVGMPYAQIAVGLGVAEKSVRGAGKRAHFSGLIKKAAKTRETWHVLPPESGD